MIPLRTRLTAMLAIIAYFFLGYTLIATLPHYTTLTPATWFDKAIPFVPFFIVFYLLGDVFLFLPLFLVKKKHDFRALVRGYFLLMTIAYVLFILIPIALPKTFAYDDGFFASVVQKQHTTDTNFNNFPSLHVAFSLYAWLFLWKTKKNVAYWTSPLVLLIIASVLLIKQHLIVDALGGIAMSGLLFTIVRPRARVRAAKSRVKNVSSLSRRAGSSLRGRARKR